jgi:hypothetical protein
VYPSRLAETDVLHPGRARTTPPLTHPLPTEAVPDASPPAGSTLRRNKSSGTNRNPAVAASPSATAGSAQPGDDGNGTKSTVVSVFVSRHAQHEEPTVLVEIGPRRDTASRDAAGESTPTAPQSVHWNSAVNGPLQRPASWPVFPSSSFTTRGDAATGRSSTVGAEVIAVPPGRKADRRPGHHHRTARTALGTVA